MFNKPSVIEAKAKVERVIMSCRTFTQLDSARRMADNFKKAYHFSTLELTFLFPQLKDQEAYIIMCLMNRPDVYLDKGVKYLMGVDFGNGVDRTAYSVMMYQDGFTYRNINNQIITGDAVD